MDGDTYLKDLLCSSIYNRIYPHLSTYDMLEIIVSALKVGEIHEYLHVSELTW